jgi:hypothetical protein
VTRKTDKWDPTLEQINDRTYDYVKLSRISGFVDIGITPYSIGIGFDGSLILPGKGYKKPLNLTVQDKDVKERQKHCLNFRVKKKNT